MKGGEEYIYFDLLIGVMMFFPGLAALAYLLWSKEGLRYIHWRFGKLRYICLALVMPTAITLICVTILEVLKLGENTFFLIKNGKVEVINDLPLIKVGESNAWWILLKLLATGAILSASAGLIVLGEEVGWRGFLQKKLLETNGLVKTLVFLGLLWGFWHFPLIASGFNYPEYPILGAFLLFPINVILVTFLLAWVSLNSGSIWPAVIIHGGINSIMSIVHSMDFGETRLEAHGVILGVWLMIAILAYFLIEKKSLSFISNHG